MKFKLGFGLGLAAGYWLANTPPDQRRAKLDEVVANVRENPRLQRVTDTVTRDARRLGDAVEQRFAARADGTTDAVASKVAPDRNGTSTTSTTTSPTSTTTSPTSTTTSPASPQQRTA